MSSQLQPDLEKFYISILNYSGLKLEDNVIKNIDERLGDFTIDGKHITLPYFNNLKNPDNKHIFHLLNENYVKPETTLFNLYKRKLVLDLNLKLSYTIINLMTLASDIQLQQTIRSSKLTEMISNIGEVDPIAIENFLSLMKASKKVNNEAYLFDIYLKKNGTIGDVPYAAIGKINFLLANEIDKALGDSSKEYKVYGCKVRKKDLIALRNIFNILFTEYNNTDLYTEGTDNKVFRYLNILLKTAYIVSNRVTDINSLIGELNTSGFNLGGCEIDHTWTSMLETIYGLTSEIRLIPNQTDLSTESSRLHVDEGKVSSNTMIQQESRQQPVQTPAHHSNENSNQQFIPNYQTQQVNQQQPQPPKQLSPEDIIRGMGNQQPMFQQYTPQFNQQSNIYTPPWVVQETMLNNQQQMHPGMMPQQQMHPGMMPQQQMHPGMMPQQQMYPGMMPQQQMYPGMTPQPSGLQINPMFLGNRQGVQ
jgi:hypothetical protein